MAGTVDEVTYKDTWSSSTNRGADRGGLSVSVVGSDGVRYYGSHLERIATGIRPGVPVRVGTLRQAACSVWKEMSSADTRP